MFNTLQTKFLMVLFAVVAVSLASTILFRSLLLSDFRAYLEGESEDKIYLVQADLESSYERYGEWQTDIVAQNAIRALMSGFEIRLYDREGKLLTNTQSAIESASPLIRKRAEALAELNQSRNNGNFVPYPLFLAGQRIGTLNIRELQPIREGILFQRSDTFLVLSMVILGGIALILSILFSRRLTRPVKELALAALAIRKGELQKRVDISRHDEVGELAESFNLMAKALETQDTLRKRLIADVAHELRTPLGAIRGEIEGLIDGLIPNDAEHLNSLYDETGRLKNMVDAIEELNKAETSRLSLDRRWIDLNSFLRNIVDRYKAIFTEKGVDLKLTCPEDTKIYADGERLSQILLNLLSNALRATPPEGVVSITVLLSAGGVQVKVSDTGRGIKGEDLPFIFERFYHGPGDGLGIGLTIVKELIDAHGATIRVMSELEKGSSFIIDFPADAVHNSS